jgi:hypothetical protein
MVVPYALALLKDMPASKLFSPATLGAIQFLQGALAGTLLGAVGLALAPGLGLQMPYLDRLFKPGGDPVDWRRLVLAPLLLGIASGALILGISYILRPQPPLHPLAVPAAWKGLLASLSAGVSEEIIMRLGMMTLLTWLIGLGTTRRKMQPPTSAYWAGNLVSALLFGAAHLPTAMALGPLTSSIVVQILVLNGGVGVLCGYLYQRRGLEAAMVCHTSADLVLHVLAAL